MEVSNLFVCLMGMGVTFIGLAGLIVLTGIMGKICRGLDKKAKEEPVSAAAGAPAAEQGDRGAMIAAVSAVIAEELGTDVSAIRIHSFKRIDGNG